MRHDKQCDTVYIISLQPCRSMQDGGALLTVRLVTGHEILVIGRSSYEIPSGCCSSCEVWFVANSEPRRIFFVPTRLLQPQNG